MPWSPTKKEIRIIISRLLEANKRYKADNLINMFSNIEGEWNLPTRTYLWNKFEVWRKRLTIGNKVKYDSENSEKFKPFIKKIVEFTAEHIDQIVVICAIDSKIQLASKANTLYISKWEDKIMHPYFTTIIVISIYDSTKFIPWIFILTQSKWEEAFKCALTQAQICWLLSPSEIVIYPDTTLTSSTVSVFGSKTKYKTCSYYIHKYINSLSSTPPSRQPRSTQNLLFSLKQLSFTAPSKISPTFTILQSCFIQKDHKSILESFSSLFLKTFNSEYWNYHYLLSQPFDIKSRYLLINTVISHPFPSQIFPSFSFP